MIPDQFLQELKYRSDIEQIIGSYVNLRRRGRTLSGLWLSPSSRSCSRLPWYSIIRRSHSLLFTHIMTVCHGIFALFPPAGGVLLGQS